MLSWEKKRQQRAVWVRGLSLALVILIFLFAAWALRSLLMPILTGAVLAYLFRPLMNRLRYSWLPENLRITIILSLILGLIFGLTQLIRTSIPNERDELELMVRIQYKLNDRYMKIMGIDEKTGEGNSLHSLLGKEVGPLLTSANQMLTFTPQRRSAFLRYREGVEGYAPIADKYYDYFVENERRQKQAINGEAEKKAEKKAERNLAAADSEKGGADQQGHLVAAIYSALSTWFVMPFVFFFLLIDNGRIEKYFLRFVPNQYFELVLTTLDEADAAIGRYLRGTLLECSLVGLSLAIGLFLVGVPLQVTLIIGLVAGLANAIPFLGPVMGLVVGLFYALIAEQIAPVLPIVNLENLFLAVFLAVVVAQVLDNAIFQPIVLGSAVNLHPLVVILGVMGGGAVFGFAGMLLTIPAIVVCKEVLSTIYRELRAYRLI